MNKTLTIYNEDGSTIEVPRDEIIRFRTEGDKTYIITETDIHEVEICFGMCKAWKELPF